MGCRVPLRQSTALSTGICGQSLLRTGFLGIGLRFEAPKSGSNRGPLPLIGVRPPAGARWCAMMSRLPLLSFFVPVARIPVRGDGGILRGGPGGAGRLAGIAQNAGRLASDPCHAVWQSWQGRLRRPQAFLRHLAAFCLDGGAVILLRIERRDLRVVLLPALDRKSTRLN